MAILVKSPCHHFGLTPADKPHPCLEPGWERPCPMSTHCGDWVAARQREMYAIGYPYAAWVVRRTLFGLRTECALHFLREKPAAGDVEALLGPGVLRVTRAI
jgi:hypothetical protein